MFINVGLAYQIHFIRDSGRPTKYIQSYALNVRKYSFFL
jgi:hypothetical protein